MNEGTDDDDDVDDDDDWYQTTTTTTRTITRGIRGRGGKGRENTVEEHHPSFTLLFLSSPYFHPSRSLFRGGPACIWPSRSLPLRLGAEQCAEKCAIGEKNGPLPLWSSGPLELFCFHLRKGVSYREATVLNESERRGRGREAVTGGGTEREREEGDAGEGRMRNRRRKQGGGRRTRTEGAFTTTGGLDFFPLLRSRCVPSVSATEFPMHSQSATIVPPTLAFSRDSSSFLSHLRHSDGPGNRPDQPSSSSPSFWFRPCSKTRSFLAPLSTTCASMLHGLPFFGRAARAVGNLDNSSLLLPLSTISGNEMIYAG